MERAQELLRYCPETGAFFFRKNIGNVKAGQQAGCTRSDGYVLIGVDGVTHYGHRLAWLFTHGAYPPDDKEIDHVDGNPSNNKASNLRLASRQDNARNGRKKRNRKASSKYKGVCHAGRRCNLRKPWTASIKINGKRIRIGEFQTEEEAHAAYVEAAQRIFGKFARAT